MTISIAFKNHFSMSRLILILAVALVGYLLYIRFKNNWRDLDRATLWRYGLIAAGVLLVVMVVTGRAHGLFAIIGAGIAAGTRLLPQLIRYFPMLQKLYGQVYGASPGTAQLGGDWIRLEMDVETGRMDGVVLDGPLRGSKLSSLSGEQLQSLWSACQSDPESTRLLHAYLQRERGGSQRQAPNNGRSGDIASREEALAILGLAPDANEEAIVLAHRRLMTKLHPDKGGSDYLASRINQAKDFLVG